MEHGTYYGYAKRGCRCEACRAAGSTYSKKWREKNPDYHKSYWAENKPHLTEYQHARNEKRRVAFYSYMQNVRAAQGCCLCGRKDGTLVHHHVDPATKKFPVSNMVNSSLRAVLDEIDKCVVLCVHCHMRWHADMRRW